MEKRLVKIGEHLIPISKGDIMDALFCDRCGIMIKEKVDSSDRFFRVGIGVSYLNEVQIIPGPGELKSLCRDCKKVVRAILDNTDCDPMIRNMLKINPEETEEKCQDESQE